MLRANRGDGARPMASWMPEVSGTDDAPWRDLSAQPGVAALASTLQEHAPALRVEALSLWRAGRFKTQPECMHQTHPDFTNAGSDSAAGAEWAQLPVVGVDFMRSEKGGCSEHTPVGCELVSTLVQRWKDDLKGNGGDAVEVERVGYSSLSQGGWIRPHWGETNARLKLHIGLVVGGQAGCAALTVGGESQAWSEGEVLFFDDSYEHAAFNNCTDTPAAVAGDEARLPRIVLQVVIRHPRAGP